MRAATSTASRWAPTSAATATTNDYATIGGKGDRYEYAGFLSNARANGSTSNSQYDTVTANILATYALTPRDRVTFKFIDNELDTNLSVRLSLNQFRQNPYQQGCAALQTVGCAPVSLFANGFTGAKVSQSAQAAGLGRHDRRTIVGARYEHDLDGATTWRTTPWTSTTATSTSRPVRRAIAVPIPRSTSSAT